MLSLSAPVSGFTNRQHQGHEGRQVLAYRFAGDAFCRAERFAAYREALGGQFQGKVLPDEAANREVTPFFQEHVNTPHSVVTVHLIDQEGEPTRKARDDIIAFLVDGLRERQT